MTIQVLVPTVNKDKNGIIKLCESLNLSSDCLIANQNGSDLNYQIEYKNHKIKVVCSSTKGVSKNRNILLALMDF